jgi:hypothetical protein
MSLGKVIDSLKFDQMLGQPFIEASKAQAALSKASMDFLNAFCLDGSGDVICTTLSVVVDDASGNMRDANGVLTGQSKKQITVPLIALLNVPSFQMQKMTVKLFLEINSMTSTDTSDSKAMAASLALGIGTGPMSAVKANLDINMNASMASSASASNKDSTKMIYDVYMEAENKPTAGLNMILQWLTGVAPTPDRTKGAGLATPIKL